MSRILHFGPGNFFRAHLAEYTFDAGGWEITAVSLRSATFRDGLRAAGGAFTLAVQGAAARRIDVIRDVLVAPEEPEAVLAAIADPEVAVISATVTEKGYACSPGDGGSFIAMLARGLARREAPVTCPMRWWTGSRLPQPMRCARNLTIRWPCRASLSRNG